MPSPLLQLRIPQDLADWLEAKYPSRGEVAEYVRQLLTAEQMKEAVAPLVPESLAVPGHWGKGLLTDEEWKVFQDGRTPVRYVELEATAEPKPKARRKKVKELESETLKAMESVEKIISPQRCNRGACTGTINPVKGRCVRCNQTPLKESK